MQKVNRCAIISHGHCLFQFEIKDRQRKQEEEYRKQHPEEVAQAKEERRRAYIVEFLPPEPPKYEWVHHVFLGSFLLLKSFGLMQLYSWLIIVLLDCWMLGVIVWSYVYHYKWGALCRVT